MTEPSGKPNPLVRPFAIRSQPLRSSLCDVVTVVALPRIDRAAIAAPVGLNVRRSAHDGGVVAIGKIGSERPSGGGLNPDSELRSRLVPTGHILASPTSY